ncbi:MAG: hypothetical protein HW403_1041, partial [Dehalococcoidia bacterium]|nr:hypothetical protein [Dehalococcoidia bacterium]
GNRLLKYDSDGKLTAQLGGLGASDGQFREPWGVAVDDGGYVYVADTWNHRIQVFDKDLKYLRKWGYFANTQDPTASPGGLFGPRDLAVDVQGNLLVSDTGNKRIQKFSPEGSFMKSYGGPGAGPGRFMEPVGLDVTSDGRIYVADTWNHRVQWFDKEFVYMGEFPVQAWQGQGLMNKPYLSVETGGNVVVTDPEKHRLLRFSSDGSIISVITGYGQERPVFNTPMGISTDKQGHLYVADSGSGRVVKLAP